MGGAGQRLFVVSLAAFAHVAAVACRPPSVAAPPAGAGAAGAAETPAFEGLFREGLARFEEGERAGWMPARCLSAARAFAAAAETPDARRRGVEARYMEGMSHQRCGARPRAERAYRAALALEPAHCGALVGLGLARSAAGEEAEATSSFHQALVVASPCPEAYLGLASLARLRGDATAALALLGRALAEDAGYVDALHEMARIHLAEPDDDPSRLDLAAVLCRQAMALAPESASVRNTLGAIELRRGEPAKAMAHFEQAATLDPAMLEAWINQAQLALTYRAYDDAARAFERALELSPHDYDALLGHGAALLALGRVHEAMARLTLATRLDPARPEAFRDLGQLYEGLGKDPRTLRLARTHLRAFVARARPDPSRAAEVEEVERCCDPAAPELGRGRRCAPGLLQRIGRALRDPGADRCGP